MSWKDYIPFFSSEKVIVNDANTVINDAYPWDEGQGVDPSFFPENSLTYTATGPQSTEYELLYRDNWLAARIIDSPIESSFEPWRTWPSPYQKQLEQEEKRLNYKKIIIDSVTTADVSGGCLVVMFVRGQPNMAAPLDMSAIKKGDLLRVVAFDPLMINKVDIEQENPLSSRYLKPKSYEISGSKRNGIIHHSRCVELHGVDLPSIQRRLIGNDYIMWGDSRLRRMKPHIEDYIETDSAISRLITRLGVLFVKEPGVSHARTTKAFAKISNAVTSVARSITTKGIYYGDSRSEIGSVNSSVAGVSNILEIKQENISGMSRLPVTELFGKAKAGMSGDTNDGDIRNKQSFVETFRSKRIEDLSDIEEVLIRSALGRLPDDCKPEWCQLSVQTATEQADIELKEAQANKANKEASNPDKDKSE